MEETPLAASPDTTSSAESVRLHTELTEVGVHELVGGFQCTFRTHTAAEPLGLATAEDAYYGLLHEGSVNGQLLLRLDRFGASCLHWELRARAGGIVEWVHDEHGADEQVWGSLSEFTAFWSELSEEAATEYTAGLLGLPSGGRDGRSGGLALSGQFALNALRSLAARHRLRRIQDSEPDLVARKATDDFAPRGQLKLILPPPFLGDLDLDDEPQAAQQSSVRLILPPLPTSPGDAQKLHGLVGADFGESALKVILPQNNLLTPEAWERNCLEQKGLIYGGA